MNATPEMTNVLQFMELRAPFSPEEKALRQNYIRDDFVGLVGESPDRIDTDLQSVTSPSVIGRLVYEHVFCGHSRGTLFDRNNELIITILDQLTPHSPLCPDDLGPITHMSSSSRASSGAQSLSITKLERHAYILRNGLYFLLPERLEQIKGLALFPELVHAFEVMKRSRNKFEIARLVKELEATFNTQPLRKIVFDKGVYTAKFQATKRTLFDTLYLLYILRRGTRVNLEHVINGLRVLHVLEALSIDSLVQSIKAGLLSPADILLKKTLEVLFPELQGWNGSDPLPTLPLIQINDDFEAYLTAIPMIHPIFARLHYYRQPFNDLKPIGIGDLKVVKQWLVKYLPGEISHIENVMKAEFKDRTHRRLEKTEETFSFSSSSKEYSQKDMQSTDRYELKREADKVVKTELSLGANASLTYTYGGGMIVGSVGANFGYKRDATEQTKTSDVFGREAIAKAIEQIERNVAETRSITKLFETEETNKHGFDNKSGKGHITGIYRWLDKQYKAQVFNFGKRMMFEFVIPEPAAFFVESRLRAFEATLELPQLPMKPTLLTTDLKKAADIDSPSDIDEVKFNELRLQYDLAGFSFPDSTRNVGFVDQATGEGAFSAGGLNSAFWQAKSYSCRLNAKGYYIHSFRVTGRIYFWGQTGNSTDTNDPWHSNTLEIYVDGQKIVSRMNNFQENWIFSTNFNTPPNSLVPSGMIGYLEEKLDFPTPLPFVSDDVNVLIGFFDIAEFSISLHAELRLSQQALLEWQTQVFNKVHAIEQQKVDKENQEAMIVYNSQLSEYHNRLAQLKATTVNQLLQGQSEAFNREVIRTELKKHCITLLTKEFDADASDDLVANVTPIKRQPNGFAYRRFEVKPTTGSFVVVNETIDYPYIALEKAKYKGRTIQFLEQAFEWQQLAYIFYPYFWASQPDWISMMSRADDADSNMTAFLQAGSVKVLLAVTPAYDQAVLHFLATREPWEGGAAPVIGDSLFIPLHEEIRKRQDDLYNATPDGKPWTFTLPTSLVYLDDSGATLPTFPDMP